MSAPAPPRDYLVDAKLIATLEHHPAAAVVRFLLDALESRDAFICEVLRQVEEIP